MAHFKAFLYDTLVNVMASFLIDLLYLVVHVVSTVPACLAIFAPSLCSAA